MGSFHQRRSQRPDASERASEQASLDVCAAARLLDLKEYDYFRLAYRRWFGRQPLDKALEQAFAGYMMRQVVPPWVQHLTRTVLERHHSGTLDAEALGAGRYRDRLQRHPHGPLYVSLTLAVWLVLFSMLLDVSYDPGTSAPMPHCAQTGTNPVSDLWLRIIEGNSAHQCASALAPASSAAPANASGPDPGAGGAL